MPASGDPTTPVTENSGQTGCVLFTDLAPGWTYTATVMNNPGVVQYQTQASDAGSASADPSVSVLPSTGTVTVTSPFLLGEGTTVDITLQSVPFGTAAASASCGSTINLPSSSAVPPSQLAVSVQQDSQWESMGNQGGYFTPGSAQEALIYPSAGGATLWAGTDSTASSQGGSVGITTPASGCEEVTLPLYPLKITGTTDALVATQGATPLALNAPSGNTTTTAVPTGEYVLSVAGSTTKTPSPQYLLVTKAGVKSCTTNWATCGAASTSAISVTGA